MNPHELDRDQLTVLLDDLDERLRADGESGVVYVVGGAAIALRSLSTDRRTGDVDAVLVPDGVVRRAAEQVAAVHGLRPDWLNARVAPWVPPMTEPLTVPDLPGLTVRLAPERHLLAMKIVAARGRRDMTDAVVLARSLGITTADGLVAVVVGAYGEEAIEAVHGGVADLRLTCAAVVRELAPG